MGCGTSKPGLTYEEKLAEWRIMLGGGDLVPVLASGAVALLDAQWIIRHAEADGVLSHRQALPKEAFLSLADLGHDIGGHVDQVAHPRDINDGAIGPSVGHGTSKHGNHRAATRCWKGLCIR